MQTFAHYALPGTILASALGAVVLCTVLLLYGFKSEPDDERAPALRLLMIRLGHALAAACFAAALMLSTVALIDQRRVAAAPTAIAPRTEDVQRLEAQVNTLEQRVAAAELRLVDVETPRPVVASSAAVESRRAAASPASRPRKPPSVPARRPSVSSSSLNASAASASPSLRDQGEAVPIQPSASGPLASTNASATNDLGAKVRDDWGAVKRGFRQAGRDIGSGFADLGRRIKHTFGRETD